MSPPNYCHLRDVLCYKVEERKGKKEKEGRKEEKERKKGRKEGR